VKLPKKSKFLRNLSWKFKIFWPGSTTRPDFKPDWRRWLH